MIILQKQNETSNLYQKRRSVKDKLRHYMQNYYVLLG